MRNKKIAILFITFFVLAFTGFMIFQKVLDSVDTSDSEDEDESSTICILTTETTEESTTEVPTTDEESTEADGPVNLFNCFTTINDWENYVTLVPNTMDNQGDTHSQSYTINDYANYDGQSSITVKLPPNCTRLVIPSMYLMEEAKDTENKFSLVFKDYDTGNVLGISPEFAKGSEAAPVEINVTGVERLTIEKNVTIYSVWHDCVVGLDGAYLYTD